MLGQPIVNQLMLTNQFGETSINTCEGLLLTGAGAPTDDETGAGVSPKGGLYLDLTNAAVYQNTGTQASPAWTQIGTANTSAVLTGYTAGAGIVAGTDTILQAFQKLGPIMNLTPAFTGANAETVSAAGALSTTKALSNLANSTGSDFAVTLAAPSSQDGQIKVLKMTVRTSNNVTLALTNVAMSGAYTPTGTTTLTFSAVGHSAVLMAVGGKWVYLGGSAVAS